MYHNRAVLPYQQILVIGYFLCFILGITAVSTGYAFYNDYRVIEVLLLLIINACFYYHHSHRYQLITDMTMIILLIVGSIFGQASLYIITDILLFYMIVKAFFALGYHALLSKLWIIASLLLFLLLPVGLYDYVDTGKYYANWYPLSWNIRVYNSYFLITSIFAVWFYLTATKYKLVYLLYLFLAFFAVLLDGGRSVTLAYSVFMAIIALYHARARVALIGVYLTSWVAYLGVTYLATMGQSSSLRIVRESSSGRLDLWQNAMSCWAEHPIIGCGFYQLDQYPHLSAHPHNLFIQVLSETGLIGFGLLLFVIYSIASRISWDMKRNAFVIAALLAVTVDMSLSGVYIYPITQMALLWLFVFLLKNPAFEHAKHFNQPPIQASRVQQGLSLAVYTVTGAWFLYLSVAAFGFSDEMPVTPPRFWVYGYHLF